MNIILCIQYTIFKTCITFVVRVNPNMIHSSIITVLMTILDIRSPMFFINIPSRKNENYANDMFPKNANSMSFRA